MTPIHERIHRAIVEAQGWEVNMFLPEDSIIRSEVARILDLTESEIVSPLIWFTMLENEAWRELALRLLVAFGQTPIPTPFSVIDLEGH